MKLIETNIQQIINEMYLVESFNLNDKIILELGCGKASMTKQIAQSGFGRKIIACEVDEIQHKKNLELDIENVEFKLYGAQDIQLEDNSIDFVFMFKSFHHIPKELMSKAIDEIERVLKPNGLAYISEPLFAGEQNELVAMFHDEEEVRKDAFEAIKKAVDDAKMKLFREVFFQSEVIYENFDDFEKKQMNQTYNDDKITKELKERVKARFEEFGGANKVFLKPFRVDILQKIQSF